MSSLAFAVRLFGASAALTVAAACGNSTPAPVGTATPGATASPQSASGAVLGVAKTSLGPVLVDSKGRTVYLLTADSPGRSTCSAECLEYWPLVSAPAGAAKSSVPGISAAMDTTKASSGASMLTVGGWPLYTFVKDKAAGDVAGEGVKTFGGTWYAVSPSGKAVKTAAKTAPSTSDDSAGGGGNGY